MKCADNWIRRIYPIPFALSLDYPEQRLATAVKYGRHCPVCTVPPHEREHLMESHPLRTHDSTQAQIRQQLEDNLDKRDDRWVHPIDNFAWGHPRFNIHQAVASDILHQLLKGILTDVVGWIQRIVAEEARYNQDWMGTASGKTQIDQRFRAISAFPRLPTFKDFSNVKQWTGSERKGIARQLLVAVAPLLHRRPNVVQFLKAVLDFLFFALYSSHDDITLDFMLDALKRMDVFKEEVRHLRRRKGHQWCQGQNEGGASEHHVRADNEDDEDEVETSNEGQTNGAPNNAGPNFNYPKWHSAAHFVPSIRSYGPAGGLDTEHSEALHKDCVKRFFPRTNKWPNFLTQLALHNDRRDRLQAMAMILSPVRDEQDGVEGKRAKIEAIQPTRDVLPLYRIDATLGDRQGPRRGWCAAEELQHRLQLDGLLECLASFIRTQSARFANEPNHYIGLRVESPDTCAQFWTAIHPSILCWKKTGKKASDPDERFEERAYCSPNWNGSGRWRRDCVMVNPIKDPRFTSRRAGVWSPLAGRQPGKIRAIVSVNVPSLNVGPGYIRYTGVVVDLYKVLNNGVPMAHHDLFEFEQLSLDIADGARSLSGRRMFSLDEIEHLVHLVEARPRGNNRRWLLNSHIDYECYNTYYPSDWEARGKAAVARYQPPNLRQTNGADPINQNV